MAVFFFIELCSLFCCWAVSSCLWKDTQIIPEQIFEKNSLDFKKYLCYTRNKCSDNDATRVRSCRGDGRTEFL